MVFSWKFPGRVTFGHQSPNHRIVDFGIPSRKRNLAKFNNKIWNIQASVQLASNLIASFGSKDDFLWDVAYLLYVLFISILKFYTPKFANSDFFWGARGHLQPLHPGRQVGCLRKSTWILLSWLAISDDCNCSCFHSVLRVRIHEGGKTLLNSIVMSHVFVTLW